MLYLVATPIGNLADLSLRAIETFKNCDYILCEDTRHSIHLLKNYEIEKPLKSFHKFNESKALDQILSDLKQGMQIALISDAGTPTLCDPGYLLVKKCREEKIEVTAIGGPCAAILALTLSGFDPIPFQFIGFLPKKHSELSLTLKQLLLYQGTSIAYESPHRLQETLETARQIQPKRVFCILRELTKIHEEYLKAPVEELIDHFKEHPPRGEIVLIIGPDQEEENWSELSLKEHVLSVQTLWNLSLNDAIKTVAQIRKIPKRTVYQQIHSEKE